MDTVITHKRVDKMISDLYSDLSKNRIIINPIYQRGRVWEKLDKRSYIDSVIHNILPIPIIFNNDNKTGLYTCMDGLQRITTIYDFMDNQYYIKIKKKKVYYSLIPDRYDGDTSYRVFTTTEKNRFNSKSISVIIYEDLTLEQQFDIFARINEGKKLSKKDINKIISKMILDNILPTPEETLDTLNMKIMELSISDTLLKSLMRIIYHTNMETDVDPLKFPRTLRQQQEYAYELDIKTEIDIKTKIVKLLSDNIFNMNDITKYGKTIILSGAYFIEKNNMYEHKIINTIMDTVKLNYTHNNSTSYANLRSVYKKFKNVYYTQTNKYVNIIDSSDDEED